MLKWETSAVGLVVASAAVLVLAVLGAAVAAPWELEERDFTVLQPASPAPPPPPLPSVGPQEATRSPVGISLEWGWLPAVGAVLLAGIVMIALWWLVLEVWRRRPTRRPAPIDVQTAPSSAEQPELPVLRRGVAQARRSLAEMSRPADAVIAAWLALQDAAAASGVPRLPSQTPTEFTVAVLDRTDADPDAAGELLSLYHSARFSGHPIGPADVDRAGRCLSRIAAGWDALAAVDGPAS